MIKIEHFIVGFDEDQFAATAPERRLYANVLAAAVADLQSSNSCYKRSAITWFTSIQIKRLKNRYLSFESVIEVLRLTTEQVSYLKTLASSQEVQ